MFQYRQEKRVLKVYEYFDESEGQILLCYKKKSKTRVSMFLLQSDEIIGNNKLTFYQF